MSDKYTIHEAMHMALFLSESIDRALLENEYIKENGTLYTIAEKASELLYDLYQHIGASND